MKLRPHLTALQTALIVGLGNLLVAVSFLLLGLRRAAHLHIHRPSHYIALSVALSAVGFVLSLKYESVLKEGIANQDWDPRQIETLRNLFQSPWWKSLAIILIFAAIFTMIAVQPRNTSLAWIFLFPSMTASRLSMSTKPPRPSTPPTDWRSFGPLHSDHWGQR